MNHDQPSSPRVRRLRSFRIHDFSLRDLPLLMLAFAVLTGVSLALAWALKFLPPVGLWLCLGLSIGFYLGMSYSSWRQRSRAETEDGPSAMDSEK